MSFAIVRNELHTCETDCKRGYSERRNCADVVDSVQSAVHKLQELIAKHLSALQMLMENNWVWIGNT